MKPVQTSATRQTQKPSRDVHSGGAHSKHPADDQPKSGYRISEHFSRSYYTTFRHTTRASAIRQTCRQSARYTGTPARAHRQTAERPEHGFRLLPHQQRALQASMREGAVISSQHSGVREMSITAVKRAGWSLYRSTLSIAEHDTETSYNIGASIIAILGRL